MTVMDIETAATTWPIACHMPNRMIQMTLPIGAPGRGPGFSTMVRPNGHSGQEAMRSAANPNGIVTITTKQISAATGNPTPATGRRRSTR